ncbi:MAG: hypothetical protein JOZ19_11075 [Rubrobacter sp.]|nr:hypothetical protein [Rubrobacter sp.]
MQGGYHEDQREEARHAVEQRVNFAGLAASQLDQDIRDEAEPKEEMLKVSGRVRIMRNAGIASSTRSQGMKRTRVIIKKPTTTRAGGGNGRPEGLALPLGRGSGPSCRLPKPEAKPVRQPRRASRLLRW